MLIEKQNAIELPGTALIELLRTALGKGVPFRFIARGFSMSPFIKDGDVVTFYPVSETKVSTGDVVAIVNPKTGKLVVHRIIGRRGNTCLIKGDNNFDTDGFIPQEQIFGRVNIVERNGRKKYLGLGKERLLIAWLMRKNLFLTLIRKGQILKNVFESIVSQSYAR